MFCFINYGGGYMKVSVIMLTYNREAMVSDMIESVLRQSMDDFEFIIVDNGSSDNSGKIADFYATKDSRIHVKHIRRSSIGAGRNVGLDYSNGDYVAFVDDDDTLEPNYLETLLSEIEKENAQIAISATNLSRNVTDEIVFNTVEGLMCLFDRTYFNTGFPTKIIKRELFDGIRFDETVKFEDVYMLPMIMKRADKIVYVGKRIYNVYRHDSNNSAWTTDFSKLDHNILAEYIAVYEKRTDLLNEEYPLYSSDWDYYKWSFYISMIQKVTDFDIPDCEIEIHRMREELLENADSFICSRLIKDFEIDWLNKYVLIDSPLSFCTA